MRPATRRLFSGAVLILMASIVDFVLAFAFQWPSEFVIGGQAHPEVTAADVVQGTVTTSIPLVPMIALAVFAVLAYSGRWWGTLAVVVLCLLGVLFDYGGWAKRSRRPRPTSLARCSS